MKFSLPQEEAYFSTQRINLILLGVGSGKTFLDGIKAYHFISEFPEVRGFIGANTYLQLTQSTLFRIREVWKSIGINEYDKQKCPEGKYVINKKPPPHFNTANHNFDEYYGIISFINGQVTFVGSMDYAVTHAGKEFGWAILDETKDTKEFDVKEIILTRLRQPGMFIVGGEIKKEGSQEQQYNPLFISTSPAKTDWINKWFRLDDFIEEINAKIFNPEDYFIKKFDDKLVIIASTYHNIKNVGQNYIDNVLNNNSAERGKALIFANPFSQFGGEYISSFNRMQHVGKNNYNPELPIHTTSDFNAVPYNSCTVWQIEKIEDIYWIKGVGEITLSGGNNSTEDVCNEVMRRYGDNKAGIFYYGDATGKAQKARAGKEEYKHHYEVIRKVFSKYLVNGSNRIATSNPANTKRRDFLNAILENKYPVRLLIDESMKKTIDDFMFCKQDQVTGLKDKHLYTDPETKEKYQKYGHLLDGVEYFLCQALKPFFKL